jgi:putative oxygen-independent coproporphyrinogen III oxidase
MSEPCAPAAGLYVHVPFCRIKCPYCDFYSSTGPPEGWVQALKREAALYQGRFGPFDSLYLGGGTPSVLAQPDLAELFAALAETFLFAPDTEVTLEANPDDLNADVLSRLRALGVNRLSVGVQSFDEDELRFLGRRHTARQTREALSLARQAGFERLSVDLLYGFAGQSRARLAASLEEALSFAPEHLSCYLLSLEPRTPFGERHARGELGRLCEEEERDFFLFTAETLRSRGYEHYEVSNFARSPAFRSRHNQKYWRHVPYLGLGPAAHSYLGRERWWNVRSVDRYREALGAGRLPVEGQETLTDEQIWLEKLYLGLRCADGVPVELLRASPGWEAVVTALEAEGLARLEESRLSLTLEGLLVADRLPLRFASAERP